jgi:tRNA U34 2-thiouridine synthase MnmA/TrmU
MFSGGLDSSIAIHLIKKQGIEIIALHFVLPFYSKLGFSFEKIKIAAKELDVPLKIIEEDEEYLEMFKNCEYGFGKNINPCLDCRIHRLIKAKKIMEEIGASFIITGEVVGQRPMSQRRDCLDIIDKKTGLKGYILRPLCAKLLKPTVPEERGWVNREELLDFWGRGRKNQIEYATKNNIKYPSPAGGCILTQKRTSERYKDLVEHNKNFTLNDFKLLAYGRHFRISHKLKMIQSRNEKENYIISKLILPQDIVLSMQNILGPIAILRGEADIVEIKKACEIFAKYTKERNKLSASIEITNINKEKKVIMVKPALEQECEKYRI